MNVDLLTNELKKYATPKQGEYIDAVIKYGSNSKAADVMGVGRRTVDRSINAAKRAAVEAGVVVDMQDTPRVLFLDIETAPILAHIWQMWSEVRNIDQLLSDWYIMTWAAKWMGEEEVMHMSMHNSKGYKPGSENDRQVVTGIHSLLNEADYIIAHNGDRFDVKKMNTRFLMHSLPPPVPYKSIDTLKMAKRSFSFTSNKLDYIARELLGERKVEHDGLKLWQRCVQGDTQSWEDMVEYNIQDVHLLERVYMKLRSWDHLHPSFATHTNKDKPACTVCGSEKVELTGDTVKTSAQAYLGYKCGDCGHQMRGRSSVRTYAQSQNTLMNAK